MVRFQFTQSSLYRFSEGTQWNKIFLFFSERFVYPNAEQLGIFAISTYKCSNNLI